MPDHLVDAHLHLWDLDRGRYPWLQDGPPVDQDTSGLAAIRRNYLPADYLADTAGVSIVGTVHVEAAAAPRHPVAETRWLDEVRAATGIPSAIVGFARLEQPDLGAVLDGHARSTALRGIRQMLNWEPTEQVAERDGILDDPRWADGLAVLSARGLSFDLQVFPSQLRRAAEVIGAHPDLTVALDHCGFAQQGTPGRWREWKRGVRLLAELPNVAVKVSSYASVDPDVEGPAWRDGFRRVVDTLADAFGPQRMMYGSNLPVDTRATTFYRALDALAAATAGWSASDRRALFVDVASRVYRLGDGAMAEP